MEGVILINKPVSVAVVFTKNGDINTLCLPKKMQYGAKEIEFTELGLRHPTKKGKRMVHVFDMSDGVNDYRLEFDAERLTWLLVSMIPGA
ncbi:hypothetical protein H6794_02195 [Candidatus Nomurabacteria bacterium]|nr:hypothetical protein [Candidatus Saccharibacteria bacterium]MCB9839642.1 hypothetical protein [Candidatus Nomurabacteria bacterium]